MFIFFNFLLIDEHVSPISEPIGECQFSCQFSSLFSCLPSVRGTEVQEADQLPKSAKPSRAYQHELSW